ncbi:MAG: hypothetical protein ACQEP6_02640 [Patescibacteria group bacterium]
MALRKKKINNLQASLMISTALLVDFAVLAVGFFNFIPGVGQPIALFSGFIINFYAYLVFITWFLVLRVRPGIIGSSLALIVGWIPFIPPWTLWVGLRILRTRYKRRRFYPAAARSTGSR